MATHRQHEAAALTENKLARQIRTLRIARPDHIIERYLRRRGPRLRAIDVLKALKEHR